jgi:hypothetical protein
MQSTVKAPGPRAFGAASTLYLLFALAFAAHASYVAWRDHWVVPYVDDWRMLQQMFSEPLWPWLFADQNGHRIPATLFLLFVDYKLFHGRMDVLVAASLACAWLAAAALRVGLRADSGGDDPVDRVRLGFCVFCLFWAGSNFDFAWGTNQGTLLSVLWMSLALAAIAAHRRRLLAGSTAGPLLPFGAGLAAAAGTFSHGMGVANWGALNAAAVAARLPRRVVGGFVVGALASLALYAWRLKSAPGSSLWAQVSIAAEDPGAVLRFMAAFVGSPLAHVAAGLDLVAGEQEILSAGRSAGTIGLVGFAVYVAWVCARRARPGELLPIGLMAFSVTGSVVVTVNRLGFPMAAVSERFLTWTTLFWAGAACALVRPLRGAAWGRWLALALAVLLSGLMVPGLTEARRRQQKTQFKLEREAAMHIAGVRWDGWSRIMTDPALVYPVVERLRRNRRNFFAAGRGDLLGAALAERYAVAPAGRCEVSLERWQHLGARDGLAFMLGGHVWDRERGRPPLFVLVTDAEQVIRGLGAVDTEHDRKRAEARGTDDRAAEWTAFVARRDYPVPYGVFAVLEGEREVCRLGVWGRGIQAD